MTTGTITNLNIESQVDKPIALQEGPIKKIPADIVGSILYFANESESTRLVSQDWNERTFAVVTYKNQELERTISVIIEKLNPDTQAQCIAELGELQDAHQFKSKFVVSFPEARQVFLTNKGSLVGILRKLSEEERDQLQNAIGDELPDSLKDVFEISKLHFMSFENVNNVNVDTFFTLLQSYQPISMDDRGTAVANLNNIEFVRLLLANGSISTESRGVAVSRSVFENNLELVRLLLANGSISTEYRGYVVNSAIKQQQSRTRQIAPS